MATFIGIDGIPGGWVAVYLDQRRQHFNHACSLDQLLIGSYERAMIDVPIGLPPRGYRICDQEARKLIGSRAFLGARWNVWKFRDYSQANAHYYKDNDKRISLQLWCIRDKLREINETMTPERQARLHEAHPELIFWRLNKKAHLENKKTDAGRKRRIALLKQHGFGQIETWLTQRRGTGIGRDDLIDACACALAARDSDRRIPNGAPPMARGIRMEMWY
jgi:predicted RNase H-like nuclease